jgi:hypothetical protein
MAPGRVKVGISGVEHLLMPATAVDLPLLALPNEHVVAAPGTHLTDDVPVSEVAIAA